MRYLLIASGISLLCLLIACNPYKDETILWETGTQTYGWVEGSINGLGFDASAYWRPYLGDSSRYYIVLTTHTLAGGLSESFRILGLEWNKGKGRYTVVEGDTDDGIIIAKYSLYEEDGHVPIGHYHLDPKKNSWVRITHADKEAGIVEGKFELHFENRDALEGLPDKVSIKNGRFEVEEYQ